MRTTVALVVSVDHDGTLTPTELAHTVGAWVEALPVEIRTVSTASDDRVDCNIVVVQAESAVYTGVTTE